MTPVQEAMKVIDDLGDPKNMSKQQWVEFLGEVEGECEMRREAAESELEEDDPG